MKLWTALLFVLAGALFAANAAFFVFHGVAPGNPFDPVDLIVIVLTAVAVIVTTLGIFIAILAIWGYNTIKIAAIEQAVAAAKTEAEAVAARTARDILAPASRKVESGGDYGAAAKGEEDSSHGSA